MKTNHSFRECIAAAPKFVLLAMAATLISDGSMSAATTLSEMLEQGIYSEETKGDLDEAMRIYQEIVTDNKAGQAIGAQAQFRLGLCHHKKGDPFAAAAAFEKLIKDYPDEKEWIAAARKYLPSEPAMLPVPWTDGEEMRLVFKFQSGFIVGAVSYSVNAAEVEGRRIWRVRSRTFAGAQGASRVEVDAETFKPIRSFWKHSIIGAADAVYGPDTAEVKMAGKDEIKKVKLDGPVYDNEQAIQMMRRLPFAEGYKAKLTLLSSLGGGSIVPLGLEVTKRENVEVPAGKFECYKVELSIMQTFWYSTDAHRYLVKFEAGGVTAELTEVRQHKPAEAETLNNTRLGFTLTAPEGWSLFQREDGERRDQTHVAILDPEATALSRLTVESLANLGPESRQSPRAWAEEEIKDFTRQLKEFQVRQDSWNERTVGGKPGVSFIADCIENQKKQVIYAVYSLGEKNGVVLQVKIDLADFDAFKPKIDAIIDSYQVK